MTYRPKPAPTPGSLRAKANRANVEMIADGYRIAAPAEVTIDGRDGGSSPIVMPPMGCKPLPEYGKIHVSLTGGGGVLTPLQARAMARYLVAAADEIDGGS